MIAVVARPEETAAVEEFFQLFKTPWEFFQPGRTYEVVIATAADIPPIQAPLLVVYASGSRRADKEAGIAPRFRFKRAMADKGGVELPIYGAVQTFEDRGSSLLRVQSNSEVAGLKLDSAEGVVVRMGYDLFQEVAFLLGEGQPVEHAGIPALDLHIKLLRDCILDAGIALAEIPPVPAGHSFIVCLTHDIDFVGIRRHFFDHTLWGFLYRATIGAGREFLGGRLSFERLLRNFRAVLSLPLVYLGWAEDFWLPFEWYLRVEAGLPATYYLIPFKHRAGDRVAADHPERRAAPYDVGDIPAWTAALLQAGCEVGVHGIDAWHSAELGRAERERVTSATQRPRTGIRIHWLLRGDQTYRVLEEAGYTYDATDGYNETVGYRCGTGQVFRPLGAKTLLELPLHIQDGALFFRQRLGLSEAEAWERCQGIIGHAREFGGVLTLLWHDRSPGPERFWGEFYTQLVQDLKSRPVWFASAAQAVDWFQARRRVSFRRVGLNGSRVRAVADTGGKAISPPLVLRIQRRGKTGGIGHDELHPACKIAEFPWTGETEFDLERLGLESSSPPAPARLAPVGA